ncbi:multiple antibiotic resistance (MarC)-related protein [Ancylobacter novellus DSM 506]|uniref:UPF0056 inner membrane protein n=1 Tax=Ancylobacter novellus (strain ATCC 8093 / DSM 506 / JCM 20403 / CCM 1077 / IAM 12100 / NBRC 12443 / NCIMB 10456) TaxID=639283 RepID=D7A585_ANCN5|nr:MarC family protein [Ancylobacter novellus]ADH89973.1 multiple antibiotic resistance (MarC)-related protein [Ancylobacter novellus DSM 506]
MSTDALSSSQLVAGFLLATPALFAIVNPVGSALVFSQMLADRSHIERTAIARRVATYAFVILITSFWIGNSVLSFFGVSLPALRIAGGLVVIHQAWLLLNAPDSGDMSDGNSLPKRGARDVTFFPLTVPITTGPGTISVAIALAAAGPVDGTGGISFVVGLTVAAALIAAMVWISDRYADLAVAQLGQTGANIVMRLSAFVLLCVGVQIMITGVKGLV